MAELALPSFEIHGFRGFSDLRIERFGRVNLIVGKNNVGKSSLLEAIQIYASRGYPPLIWELLKTRDELGEPSSARLRDTEELLATLKYLFFGRKILVTKQQTIRLGPLKEPDSSLSVSLSWVSAGESPDSYKVITRYAYSLDDPNMAKEPVLEIQFGHSTPIRYALEVSGSIARSESIRNSIKFIRPDLALLNCVYVSANSLTREEVGDLWDSISLTDLEPTVLDAIRIIAPGVEAFTLVANHSRRAQDRIPIVRVAGSDMPIPLRSLGDGMQRMLSIALALVNAKDGILLVDEIENGLHYQVQPQLWRVIFETARQLNVQVFATSHSWDCIRAFQKVAREDEQSAGMLIRLEAKKNKIAATLFDERELEIATREQIEVR
jgi:ABC-type lipoprotein export system ATPase subunit